MNTLVLDNYLSKDWENDKDYTRIMNTVKGRKFQPTKRVQITPAKNNSLDMICASRVANCQDKLNSRRDYTHKVYEYDSMNELERFGVGRYARRYVVIISFEDSLDFIYSCVFKTRLGDLTKFCNEKGMDYTSYSRQHLGGGKHKDLYLTDLEGFSPAFDIVLNSMSSDESMERRLYFAKIMKFCKDFRNALMVHVGGSINDDSSSILASVGVTSLVYYSDAEISGVVPVEYKSFKTNLKILCVEQGKYFNALQESLCC